MQHPGNWIKNESLSESGRRDIWREAKIKKQEKTTIKTKNTAKKQGQ